MPGPTGSRKRSGGKRNPCSYCTRDGNPKVHVKIKAAQNPSHELYARRSCKGKGARFYA